jgi:hypothetical protein
MVRLRSQRCGHLACLHDRVARRFRFDVATCTTLAASSAGVHTELDLRRIAVTHVDRGLGIVDESGPYYGFWSGFGSDIAEFSLVGAAVTGVYQLNRKYNCHQRGCWRIGTHPAAGGQFLLCYRHHPDYQGKKPTRELPPCGGSTVDQASHQRVSPAPDRSSEQ